MVPGRPSGSWWRGAAKSKHRRPAGTGQPAKSRFIVFIARHRRGTSERRVIAGFPRSSRSCWSSVRANIASTPCLYGTATRSSSARGTSRPPSDGTGWEEPGKNTGRIVWRVPAHSHRKYVFAWKLRRSCCCCMDGGVNR
jgi:hypothetical protein